MKKRPELFSERVNLYGSSPVNVFIEYFMEPQIKAFEPAGLYRFPYLGHELVIEPQVMQYAKAHSKALVGLKQMADVCP